MRQFTAIELAHAVEGILTGIQEAEFSRIAIDSRTISDPGKTVFFALKGRSRDGHTFIPELIRKGLTLFVVNDYFDTSSYSGTLTFIKLKDSLEALQKFAGYIRASYKGKVIAVTGSNGKTIVKEWLYQILKNEHKVFRSPLSFNSQVGVPLALSLLENVYDIAIIEAGISLPGEMKKLEKIIKPEIGIITNIGEAHQENFSSHREKLKEKLILFKNSEIIIYCRDHKDIHNNISKFLPENVKKISWGTTADSDYQVKIRKNADGTLLTIKGLPGSVLIPFFDNASVENALHAIVLSLIINKNKDKIIQSAEELESVEMRVEILKGINSCTLINDTYNSDIQSVKNSIELLMQQNQHKEKIVILSDIFQSGKSNSELTSEIAKLVNDYGIQRFFGIGQTISQFSDYFAGDSFFYRDTTSFLKSGIWSSFKNAAILIKGSRSFEFENITGVLQEKKHQTRLEINLSSLISNLNIFKSLLKPSTKIMGMVKAFSYGSGSYEIANKLQFHKVDYLAVAYVDEGVELRKNGINLPIMVMNPDPSSFYTIVDYKLEPELYSREIADQFISFADRSGLKHYPVHIELDTGMHRLGFDKTSLKELLDLIPSDFIEIVSVFSHLAAAEDTEHDDFTRKQISDYIEMCDLIRYKYGNEFVMHILNSAGIKRFPEAQFDMVRLGIGLYGVDVAGISGLQEISTFKTHITQIRSLNANDTVGYGRVGKINKNTKVAVIPAGYADGIPRSLSNGAGHFLIGNKMLPVIGNICMDMCMLDLTDIDAKEGDEVIIFGPEASVKDLAVSADTIPYEILSGIPSRVKRIYLEE